MPWGRPRGDPALLWAQQLAPDSQPWGKGVSGSLHVKMDMAFVFLWRGVLVTP